jgi:P27 family predicted phage terminase small subunit
MRGRKPKPTTIKLVTGNPGHRPTPPDEPKPEARIPKCPTHLDAEAKREWRRMARELEHLGILTTIDRAVFASYCQAWSTWRQALKTVQKVGMVVRSKERVTEATDGTITRTGGVPMVNPLYKLVDAENAKMMKALTEMGMSPSSRSRVSAAERKPAEADRRERFFK